VAHPARWNDADHVRFGMAFHRWEEPTTCLSFFRWVTLLAKPA
jgi:hypothetical protein